MNVFHVFLIVQMVLNRAKYLIYCKSKLEVAKDTHVIKKIFKNLKKLLAVFDDADKTDTSIQITKIPHFWSKHQLQYRI